MRFGPFVAAVLASLGLAATHASAAPQLLGVVASAEPVPMHCEGGTCMAELSAFCLEKERSIPQDGTAYQALDSEQLTLVVTGADGAVRRLPAAGRVSLVSRRSQVAVEVSLPESALSELGASKLALAAAPELALVPVAEANDAQPIRADEIAAARETMGVASGLFQRDNGRTRTVHMLNRLINALPGNDGADPALAERAWQVVVGSPFRREQSDPVLADLARTYESCRLGLADIWPPGLRRCLEVSHDATMGGVNADFWKIVGAGS